MTRSREVQGLLDQFVGLAGANQVYGQMSHDRDTLRLAMETGTHPILESVAGKTFALFAYDYHKRSLPEGRTLLTPRTTLEFYSRSSGRSKVKTQDGQDITIAGMTTPDGLEFGTGETREIDRLHEYKVSSHLGTVLRQMTHLTNVPMTRRNLRLIKASDQDKAGRTLRGLLGDNDTTPVIVPYHYEVRYTVPENSALRGVTLPPNVIVDYLPIHSAVFGQLIHVVAEETLAGNLIIPRGPRIL